MLIWVKLKGTVIKPRFLVIIMLSLTTYKTLFQIYVNDQFLSIPTHPSNTQLMRGLAARIYTSSLVQVSSNTSSNINSC